MSRFVDAEVPFVVIGNRRGLTDYQIMDNPWLEEFFTQFRHCFERNDMLFAWVFTEPDE